MEEKEMTGYPSIDKPWLKYYSDGFPSVPKCTIWRNIYDNNKDYPNDIALMYYGRKITYEKLFQNVETAKRAFITAGVKRGDNVAFLMLSCPEMVYAILALNQLGAVANMVNPTFTAEQMRDRINDSEANIILILDQLYDRLTPVISEICPKKRVIVPLTDSMPYPTKIAAQIKMNKRIPVGSNQLLWKNFIENGAHCSVDIPDEYIDNTPAIMVYSSGSTGASKGIVLVNDGINHTIAEFDRSEHGFTRQLRFLHMGAPWLSTMMVICLLMPLKKGMIVILEPLFTEEQFLNGMYKYHPNATLTTVSHWLYAINSPKLQHSDLSELVFPLTGGEKVISKNEKRIVSFFEEHGCNSKLYVGYGMCELGSGVASNSRNHVKIGSVGYPIGGVSIAAFDINTNQELKTNERGEIRVLTPTLMKEYYKRPDATAEFFWKDQDGRTWGRTGDIGYVDEDGFIYIQGRATDTFKLNDGKVHYCFDVEDIILTQDGVDQCEVVAIPNSDGYDDLHCFVVKEAKSTISDSALVDGLRTYCREALSADEVPKTIRVLNKFPIKPSGKRDMDALRKLAKESNSAQ